MPAGPRPRPPDFTAHTKLNHFFQTMPWSVGFWFKVDTADTPDLGDFQTFLDNVIGAWQSDVMPFLSSAAQVDSIDGVFYGAGSDTIDVSSSSAGSGGGSATSLPINCACCISWPTATHYRGGHPRTYVGGLPDDAAATVSTFDSAFTADIAAGATSFRDDCNDIVLAGDPVQLGVVSFVHLGDWRDPPIFRPFTGDPSVDLRIDSQRRRLGR